ncbi:MAG: response regulator [Gemmataceae bacterium]
MTTVPEPMLAPSQASSAASGRRSRMVLVVDDAAVDRRLAGGILEKSGNYRIVYANNGLEALAVMAQDAPDVVLTDLIMPQMGGLELVEQVNRQYPHIPIILMTAHGSEDIAMQALQRGASSYVPKKVLAQDLIDTLDHVLAVTRPDLSWQCLTERLACLDCEFTLENNREQLSAMVTFLQDELQRWQLCDQGGLIRVGIALEEALVNALYHGNLELSSDLRQEGDQCFYQHAEQRRSVAPYRDRRIFVRARLARDEVAFTVRDEGPGFDPSLLDDPTDPENLEKISGRGLLLIQTFMDEVRYNEQGNQITMVLRRQRSGDLGT